jgi:hypothetical protein
VAAEVVCSNFAGALPGVEERSAEGNRFW